MELITVFPDICRMPNGLQWHEDHLYIVDQFTDDVLVITLNGDLKKRLRTETENGSGITVSDEHIWVASNGPTQSRKFRQSDTHRPMLLKLDAETGQCLEKFDSPDGGGIHGLAWDDGLIWMTQFNPKSLILFNPATKSVIKYFKVNLEVPHGLAIDTDGIWCSDRLEKVIVKYDATNGNEISKITLPTDGPDPHGLSITNGVLWYSDADFPPPSRGYPEIGMIVL